MSFTSSSVRCLCLLASSTLALACEGVGQEPVPAESTASEPAASEPAASEPAESMAAEAGEVAAADAGSACPDVRVDAPEPGDAGAPETLEEYVRWRTATSPAVQVTRRGCPLTIEYQIK